MKAAKDSGPDLNLVGTSLSAFVQYYNKNIPGSFPRATAEVLAKFRAAYPSLFAGGSEEWTIEKHRKKLMDWLASYEALL